MPARFLPLAGRGQLHLHPEGGGLQHPNLDLSGLEPMRPEQGEGIAGAGFGQRDERRVERQGWVGWGFQSHG